MNEPDDAIVASDSVDRTNELTVSVFRRGVGSGGCGIGPTAHTDLARAVDRGVALSTYRSVKIFVRLDVYVSPGRAATTQGRPIARPVTGIAFNRTEITPPLPARGS